MHVRTVVLVAVVLALPVANAFAGVVFSEPVVIVEGPPSAIRLAISPDGTRQLYGEPRKAEHGGLQIRERHRTDAGWSEPGDVAFNTRWNDFDPAFAPDGSGVYFFSNRPGGAGGDDLWFVPLEGGAWGEPLNLGAALNTSGDEWAPTPLSGDRLLFSSDGHEGHGGQDLYIAERTAAGWGTPQNLGPAVNSAQDDYDAALLPEGVLLLTRSTDPDSGSEIFYSCRSAGSYTEARLAGPNVNLGGGFALGPSVSATEPGSIFFSALPPGAQSASIYRARYRIDCAAAGSG